MRIKTLSTHIRNLAMGCLLGATLAGCVAAPVAGGAAAGALVAENALAGALIGGAVGAASAHLIGAHTDWFEGDRRDEARHAAERSGSVTYTSQEALQAESADLNEDGLVTTQELIALERAGLGDAEILQKLRATNHVFQLSPAQRDRLLAAGMSPRLLDDMEEINRDARDRILARRR